MAIPRATAAYLSTLEESVVTYVCNPGTVSEGDNTAVCLHDGKWTDTNLYCRRKYSFARFKKLGNIFQMFFYNLSHKYPIYYKTVNVSNSSCLLAECGPPPSIQRAIVSAGNWTEGSTLTYMCHENTVMEGTPSITCQNNGVWSDTNLYCRREWFKSCIVVNF